MMSLKTTSSSSLNSMLHGAVTAKSLHQNTVLLLKSLPKTTHHSPLLKLMPPKRRSSLKDSVSKASQHSTSSKTEKRLTTQVEELQTPLSHGFSRNQDHHPLLLPVLPLRKKLKATSSLLLTSVQKIMISTLVLMSDTPTLKTRLPSCTLMMETVPLNMDPQFQVSSSSESSRQMSTHTPVQLTRIHLSV